MTQPPRSVFAKAASAVLLLALAAPAAASTVLPFNNTGAITINVQGNAAPYPSNITVSGVPTNFTRLEVQLNGFTHSFPDDVDVLLVGPQGQRAILMSDAGGPGPGVVTGQTLTFAQTAANPIPDATAPASGTFRPANYIESAGSSPVDTFPTPGPGALTDAPADLFVFNGINPNGVWSLFVVDDANGDFGSISGGWTLRFTAPTVFTVTKTADTNDGVCNADCSLREALALARDGDLVNFSTLFNTPQTINLLTVLPLVEFPITIQGTGANLLTVRRDFNAATNFRIFSIGGFATNGVTISGMTITGGNVGNQGGGILSFSHLTLNNVHVTGNTAFDGGGVNLQFADGIFTNCTFSNNFANDSGGGISHLTFGRIATLRVINSTISGNRSANRAGGIITASDFDPKPPDADIRLEITNSTIANNSAVSAGGVETATLSAGVRATTTLRNSIITGNSPTNLAIASGGAVTTFQTLGFNLSNNYNSVFTPLASDITSATPRLAPLALYGGQTPTHALLHASPAINAGDASGATTDQRGLPRVTGASADIGAVEMRPVVVGNTNDGGPFSLRNSVIGANADTQIDDILFDHAVFGTQVNTIVLLTDELFVSNPANIIGPGANLLGISGNSARRVLQIGPNASATVSGVTIIGGNANGDGGGIFNDGVLTVTHSRVSDNTSAFNGGGIGNGNGDRLIVSHSTLFNNGASVGGGINNNGVALVDNTTLSGNSAQVDGGGIHSQNGSLGVISATITNNTANGANRNSGIRVFSGTGVFRNSIIAGNVNNANNPDVGGTGISSNGFNLIGNPGSVTAFNQTTDQSGTGAAPLNPLLGPRQNNGGTTTTHALLFGSPALDRGNSSGFTRDQTGQTRPVDVTGITNTSDGADIGAFEAQTAPINPAVAPTVTFNPGSSLLFPSGPAGTASSSISVSSSGGVAPGTVTVSGCSTTGGFTITNAPINLTGTAGGAQINGSINLSCTRGASSQPGSLNCNVTPNPGSPSTRSVSLECPIANEPPTLAYSPVAGSTINYSTNGTASAIVVTPSGGSGSGPDITTRLGACQITNGGAAFPTTTIAQLSFVGATTTVQNLNLPNCAPQSAAVNATLTCPETRGTAAAVNRSWTLNCPAAPLTPVAPTVTYAPSAGSTINFPTGAAGTATSSIAVSSSGGAASGTVNVASCSAPAGFTITNAPINLTGTAGGAQISGNINLSCTRGASLQTGTLSCSETPTPGTGVTRNWNLSCPAAAGDPIFGNGFEG